ncbi:MAG: MBL fold metallo-hydrolase [Thermoanaerobaculia bacterium]
MTIPEITPRELLDRLEPPAGSDAASVPSLQVLDTRPPERAARGHIEAGKARDYINVPGSQLAGASDAAVFGLDRTRPVAVVCDRGMSSRPITNLLLRQGFEARSLVGGMLGWMRLVAPRPVPDVAGLDALFQLDRIGKGALGYLALRDGEALAVDPGRDLAVWKELLTQTGARLVGVVDTHTHADYLSGGPALAEFFAVPYRLSAADAIDPFSDQPARIVFSPLIDGSTIAVGGARFDVAAMPGHTPGSTVLRLGQELALTGDFLFTTSIGRPDLAGRSAEWTALLWQSLQRAKGTFPPDLRLFPGHYAGESERRSSGVVEIRFGELDRRHPAAQPFDEASFGQWVKEHSSAIPEEYRYLKQANLGLLEVDAALADELEAGKNRCAVGA